MKNMKKKILALALATAMGATAAYGTVAYFTDQEQATNTFTVGNVAITLSEPGWDSLKGLNIVPSREISKNPTVTVEAKSVASYVRMTVTMPETTYWASSLSPEPRVPASSKLIEFIGMSPSDWKQVGGPVVKNGEVVLTYDYKAPVASADTKNILAPLFTGIKISENVTNAKTSESSMSTVLKDFNIKIDAYAVQAEGFTTADAAFAAGFPKP